MVFYMSMQSSFSESFHRGVDENGTECIVQVHQKIRPSVVRDSSGKYPLPWYQSTVSVTSKEHGHIGTSYFEWQRSSSYNMDLHTLKTSDKNCREKKIAKEEFI